MRVSEQVGPWRWLLTALVASVLVLWPAGVVVAQEAPPARGIEGVCPPPAAEPDPPDEPDDGSPDGEEGTPEEAGSDPAPALPSDLGTTHAAAIECALRYALLRGYPDGTFRPADPITRAQMASFVVAWLGTATGFELPAAPQGRFEDTEGSVHEDAIDRLAAAEVVAGRSETRFGSRDTLSRGQFTRVVANAISYADVFQIGGALPPRSDERWFSDIEGTTFEATIRDLAAVGLATGTGDGAFDPSAPVTRGQLATFLMRAADYLDEQQRWLPTAVEVVFEGDLIVIDEELLHPEPEAGGDGDGAGDGADGAAQDPDAAAEDPDAPSPPVVIGDIVIAIDAFGGQLVHAVRLHALPGSEGVLATLALYLGDPTDGGELVIELADEVPAVPDEVQTGRVFESDTTVRFADLARAPEGLVVLVTTVEHPDGLAAAALERIDD